MTRRHDTVVVRTGVRLLAPIAQIYALYVLFHGHYSPGGGFQGGVIFAAAYILVGLAHGREELERRIRPRALVAIAGLGVLVYLTTGILPFFWDARYLDYGAIEFLGHEIARRRAWGILMVESGVFLTVFSVITLLFLRLTEERP
jgi:multicomponent Na+:H+ antiporter subunit B